MIKKLSIFVVLAALTLAITSLWNDSFTVDEIPHVGAGYSYITKGDFRLNPEHPPLAKDVAGFSLSLLSISQSAFSTQYWTGDVNGQWNFGRTLIYDRTNNVDVITRTAKTTMLIFFVLSALIIFRWTNELYGSGKSGLTALFLFAFSPTVLAHSRFVTTDMPALFGILLGTYFFIKFIRNPTRKSFWFAALAFGVAQLTKFSAVLLAPLFIFIIVAWSMANSFSLKSFTVLFIRSLILMALGIILVVWPVYALHTINYPPERQRNDAASNLATYGNRLFADPVVWASDKPMIRPLAQYAMGILMVNQRSAGGNTTFFLGEVRNYAWKYYFPVVYAIKEPLPFWLLTIAVLLYLAAKMKIPNSKFQIPNIRRWIKTYFVEFSMLLWIVMYWFLSIKANLNIGVRHLLPTYSFVYILLAGQIVKIIQNAKLKNSSRLGGIPKFYILIFTFLILLGWYITENIRVYPYYLTYFNQLAGGSSGGYRYVVDSNLDWGQDLKRLAMWVEKNISSASEDKIYLDYFGWADQNYYLKDKFVWLSAGKYKSTREFLADNLDGGYIAVSASFYMGSRENPETSYAWLDSYKPIATIGNSIFVWHIVP
ncbi:MAG: hypothetical protein A3J46_02455 [Candidatus Yanofskybacteria bacterium RIFCSPHIGHO2_02_FULL_41_11]|uniref:ArnT-like N-terminal domain-containing protein n=1 Tax=Candidatus Yanofskybacteria bacterium RIFCSPHIGHO2_02_FULL_41_11 TaxID=1802675 RepID=A0A1F8F9G1_9BACT|nr:MAG: hypothetical protein A3J46_02455 [Candidatus Yanofskybacteria bacterium RIFCSPHIGHO2_02_FULL_41_11]